MTWRLNGADSPKGQGTSFRALQETCHQRRKQVPESMTAFGGRLTLAAMVTSTLLPGETRWPTGKPLRVTGSPTSIYGTSLRPFFVLYRLRGARQLFAPAARGPLTPSFSPQTLAPSSSTSCIHALSKNAHSRPP